MMPPNLPDKSTALKAPKLFDQVRDKLRVERYVFALNTLMWIGLNALFCFMASVAQKGMAAAEVEALSGLRRMERVSV